MNSKMLILGAMLCLVLCASTGQAKTTKTVQVDCTKGESIGAALEKIADELIIEISGLCYENVTVLRDDVTFQGTNPALDGIAGPTPGSDLGILVDVRHASRLTFRNLSFANSNQNGLWVRHGQSILVENCVFQDNPQAGARFYDASTAEIYSSSFQNNGRNGLVVSGPTTVNAYDSSFVGNGSWAVFATEDATVRLFGSACSVDGDTRGLAATQDAFIWVSDCSLNVPNGVALWAIEQSDLNLALISFVGDLRVQWNSFVWLVIADQAAPGPDGNVFAHNSTLLMQYGAGLVGTTTFDTFSNGSFEDGPASFDVLLCENGGDFACGGPAPAANSGSTGCGACP